LAGPRVEKSFENPEASLWILIVCDFHLRPVWKKAKWEENSVLKKISQ
jgi:hypothetical protein